MKLETYMILLRNDSAMREKFTDEDFETIQSILEQSIKLQKESVQTRLDIKYYNEQVKRRTNDLLKALSQKYINQGEWDEADCIESLTRTDRLRYKPYETFIRKMYHEIPAGKEIRQNWLMELNERNDRLSNFVKKLQAESIFSSSSPDYCFTIGCIKRYCKPTMSHDLLSYYVENIHLISDWFNVGVPFRDSSFEKSIKENSREDFLNWLATESIRKEKEYILMKKNIDTHWIRSIQ